MKINNLPMKLAAIYCFVYQPKTVEILKTNCKSNGAGMSPGQVD